MFYKKFHQIQIKVATFQFKDERNIEKPKGKHLIKATAKESENVFSSGINNDLLKFNTF